MAVNLNAAAPKVHHLLQLDAQGSLVQFHGRFVLVPETLNFIQRSNIKRVVCAYGPGKAGKSATLNRLIGQQVFPDANQDEAVTKGVDVCIVDGTLYMDVEGYGNELSPSNTIFGMFALLCTNLVFVVRDTGTATLNDLEVILVHAQRILQSIDQPFLHYVVNMTTLDVREDNFTKIIEGRPLLAGLFFAGRRFCLAIPDNFRPTHAGAITTLKGQLTTSAATIAGLPVSGETLVHLFKQVVEGFNNNHDSVPINDIVQTAIDQFHVQPRVAEFRASPGLVEVQTTLVTSKQRQEQDPKATDVRVFTAQELQSKDPRPEILKDLKKCQMSPTLKTQVEVSLGKLIDVEWQQLLDFNSDIKTEDESRKVRAELEKVAAEQNAQQVAEQVRQLQAEVDRLAEAVRVAEAARAAELPTLAGTGTFYNQVGDKITVHQDGWVDHGTYFKGTWKSPIEFTHLFNDGNFQTWTFEETMVRYYQKGQWDESGKKPEKRYYTKK